MRCAGMLLAITAVACSSKKAPDPSIKELEALRDQMCACTSRPCIDDMWKTVKT